MATLTLHPAESRGRANFGWLNSYHSFSFGEYYNPERMGFGALRVLNDDTVAGGQGFGRHPHQNMEIISIPLSGDLEHKDSMDNVAVIRAGDVQVLSAGRGIYHSEYNKNADKEVKFLQIWVIPKVQGVEPRYDQYRLDPAKLRGRFQQILSPSADDDGVWIHQDAWFHLGHWEAGSRAEYALKKPGNGVYAFVLEGDLSIEGQELGRRDALGIEGCASFSLNFSTEAGVLLMEVPMG